MPDPLGRACCTAGLHVTNMRLTHYIIVAREPITIAGVVSDVRLQWRGAIECSRPGALSCVALTRQTLQVPAGSLALRSTLMICRDAWFCRFAIDHAGRDFESHPMPCCIHLRTTNAMRIFAPSSKTQHNMSGNALAPQ